MGRFDSYSGLLTAYPYAFGRSDSRLFKSYALVSALLAGLFTFLMLGAVLVLLGNTAGARGGTLTLSRTFYVLVGLAVFFPLVAPVLLVARRHRTNRQVTERYDAALAATGYLFVLTVYLLLVISTPAQYRESVSGATGTVVSFFYSLPPLAGLIPPALAVLLMFAAHRQFG